ncbi:hypothetical protein M8332_07015 (plasmid) [Fructilactobacillus ixorae]|uniref:Uncharacterized protein n=1 Tax=Fructilactobacillus ixorae TaxID=1750535 RepID=A0ABY5C5A5_9LACO|nr:hypothetical protein [Fructilactobacillus ixorae]USS93966.1 hypothetical protein M8332_07015 [Fructilactobacillus ixorae]
MNDTSIVELHKEAARQVAFKVIEPIANEIRRKYVVIDTKTARELTCQSVQGWQEIAKTPEMRSIEHHKLGKNGIVGRSIYYYADDFYPTVRKALKRIFD